jgi:glyceraldehyde 3-phosphate dehydrogenase
MTVRVAINGFGRIGRNILRSLVEHGRTDIEVVAINDLGPVETNAHLFRYDSVHGRFAGEVKVDGDTIDVGRGRIKVTAVRDPAELPHRDLGVDIAFECTGIFTSRDKASAHLAAGAKRVLVSAPCDNADKTIVYGVNHNTLTADDLVVSNASCTTNCLAPVAKVLHDLAGIERGYMTTIHAYTGDQATVDTLHKDRRRARAAALSMIPTSTGAAKAVGLVLPGQAGGRDDGGGGSPTRGCDARWVRAGGARRARALARHPCLRGRDRALAHPRTRHRLLDRRSGRPRPGTRRPGFDDPGTVSPDTAACAGTAGAGRADLPLRIAYRASSVPSRVKPAPPETNRPTGRTTAAEQPNGPQS